LTRLLYVARFVKVGRSTERLEGPERGPNEQGASEMQALLIPLICLVILAILAGRYGVDSRDGLDWKPPHRARSRGRL
jgi:hypothetical protein